MNYFAVIVAALSSFMLGGLWYSKTLFGTLWLRENGDREPCGHPAKVFGISFAFSLLAAYAFASLLGFTGTRDLGGAIHMGLMVGVCFVATSFGINYQFADRSTKLWLVDGGYHVAQFLIFGLIQGLWI